MKYQAINDEVLYTTENITKINSADIDQLKVLSRSNPRKRIRICTHPNIEDNMHEMIIVHASGAYVIPHKHIGKREPLPGKAKTPVARGIAPKHCILLKHTHCTS